MNQITFNIVTFDSSFVILYYFNTTFKNQMVSNLDNKLPHSLFTDVNSDPLPFVSLILSWHNMCLADVRGIQTSLLSFMGVSKYSICMSSHKKQ